MYLLAMVLVVRGMAGSWCFASKGKSSGYGSGTYRYETTFTVHQLTALTLNCSFFQHHLIFVLYCQ
jgi:hypothetical protein